jgi:hypothetical protein
MAKPKPPKPGAKPKAKPKPHKHRFTKADTTNGEVIHWCSVAGCDELIKRPRDKDTTGKAVTP